MNFVISRLVKMKMDLNLRTSLVSPYRVLLLRPQIDLFLSVNKNIVLLKEKNQ
jgi:hypothetical protein